MKKMSARHRPICSEHCYKRRDKRKLTDIIIAVLGKHQQTQLRTVLREQRQKKETGRGRLERGIAIEVELVVKEWRQ